MGAEGTWHPENDGGAKQVAVCRIYSDLQREDLDYNEIQANSHELD
jgi:hypothetical protein